MEMKEMIQVRTRTITKANDLIQKSRFNLSTQQQKIILYLISKIKQKDEDFKYYDFSIPEFCKVCGIDYKNSFYYTDIKKSITEIAEKCMWVELEKDKETTVRWIDKAILDKNNGTIQIRLDNDLKPFLLQLKANYTQYELIFTLKFKSKFSIRLYEFIKSIHYNELEEYTTRIFSLEELKTRMGAETYKTWQNFSNRVLFVAVNEINKYSDKNVECVIHHKGRKVVGVAFKITTKEPHERLKLYYSISDDLGYNQMMIEGFEE